MLFEIILHHSCGSIEKPSNRIVPVDGIDTIEIGFIPSETHGQGRHDSISPTARARMPYDALDFGDDIFGSGVRIDLNLHRRQSSKKTRLESIERYWLLDLPSQRNARF